MSTNCGNADHGPYCLCDVIAPHDDISCTSWVDPITDGFFGREIAAHLGISRPYTADDLVEFFRIQTELYDQLAALERIKLPARRATQSDTDPSVSKIPREVLAEIALKVINDEPSADIRRWAVDTHNIKISPSHMSHLRRRLIKENA